ncbi:hypothetical protein [Pseudarthrobacter siccitolerans]|nr:hypothetical protein [Pseudarthrobacter siccitolerans]
MSLTDSIDQEMEQRRSLWEKDGSEVKLFQYAGLIVHTISGDQASKEDAPGWIYSYTGKVGLENVTVVGRAVADSGRYVFVEAQAPSGEFSRYETSFEKLLARLVVYSDCASCVK